MPLKLYITNKNYSSWSMRPWVVLREFQIPFEEVFVRLDAISPDSEFRRKMKEITPVGKVPVLVDSELGAAREAIWDSLSICEYLAESHPERPLWPEDRAARARARCLCADMHSGFATLRSVCPMNIEATLPEVGEKLMRENAGLRADLERMLSMWEAELGVSGGPFLFGAFSIADAFFAPVCMRIRTYNLPLGERTRAYLDAVVALGSVQEWIRDACAEKDFLQFEEPYRSSRE